MTWRSRRIPPGPIDSVGRKLGSRLRSASLLFDKQLILLVKPSFGGRRIDEGQGSGACSCALLCPSECYRTCLTFALHGASYSMRLRTEKALATAVRRRLSPDRIVPFSWSRPAW